MQAAVVRSDAATPRSAQSVVVLRREVAVPVASRRAGIKTSAGHAVGVAPNTPSNRRLLDTLLAQYDVARERVSIVPLAISAVAPALRGCRVDAALLVGPESSRAVAAVVAAAPRDEPDALTFVAVDDAAAIVKNVPALEQASVEQGAFGGNPSLPPERLDTVGFAVRLLVRADLGDDLVAELTRQVLAARTTLAATVPEAGLIEVPSAGDPSPVALHPGVRAFLNGGEKSLFDRYSEVLYIAVTALGLVGSVGVSGAGFLAAWARRRRMTELLRIGPLLAHLETAWTPAEVDAAGAEIEVFFQAVLARAESCEIETADVAAAALALDQLRVRVAERRRVVDAAR